MDVVSNSPLRTAELRWVLSNGGPALTVVCKATFTLAPGEATLAAQQEPPAADEPYWDDAPDKPAALATDLVPFKPRADVVVTGRVYTPQGRPSALARMIVGTIDKSAEVGAERDPLAGPVFGPVGPTSPARRQMLHRHARAMLSRDWPSRPLPEDLDRAFFNIAPPDQQADEIRPNERVVLDHLHPDHPRLVTQLPGIEPTATVVRPGRSPSPLNLKCDTLWIDSDRGLCWLVWRGILPLAQAAEPGQIVIACDAAAGPVSLKTRADLGPSSRDAAPFALPFGRTGVNALRDLSASAVATAAPASVRPFSPPSVPRPAAGMPHRAVTMDIPPSKPFAPPPPPVAAPPLAPSPLAPSPLAPSPLAPSPLAPSSVPARAPQGSIGERLAIEQAADTPETAPAPLRETAPRRGVQTAATSAITLLWLDPWNVPRMRRKPAFREVLDALEEKEPDAELDASVPGTPADVDDHRAVFEIVTQAPTTDADGLQRAMIEALREDGKLVAPLLHLGGELAFPFDELETLRATAITVSPLVGADEPQLRAAVDAAREFLRIPDLTCAPAVAEGMTQRIREAFAQGKRVVPAGYLDAQTERALLDQRRYQRRVVFGGTHLRALLHLPGAQAPVPCYLPDSVAPRLPLFQRVRARVIATCHLAEDQSESHPFALRALALARLAPPPGAGLKPSSRP